MIQLINRKFKFSLVFLIVTLNLSAQNTQVKYLSGKDKDHTVKWDFFCTQGMNSGKWTTIEVPSQWEQQGFGLYNYGKDRVHNNEQGFYKYKFLVPKNWKNLKTYIVFEGSMTDTEVKINGTLAGSIHQGSFYQFRYDISSLIHFNKENLLEVTVSKESANKSVNNAERRGDYWVFGGIYRPVYLEAHPNSFIERVAIDAKANGSFYMDVFVQNGKKNQTLEAQIQTLAGVNIGNPIGINTKHDDTKYTLTASILNPKGWNPENPNRYKVLVSLNENGKIKHLFTQNFGFRTVEFKPADGFYVNGTKILFKGVCRHTFWPSSGRTSSKQLAINDVNLIKDMNMNAVRMTHYPPDQYFLDVCDSLGLFVINELAGWQAFYETPIARDLVRKTVIRDVNHPSILIWANGNENGFNPDVRSDYALYDPQKRVVIEPWAKLNGTDTKHYPKYSYISKALTNGKLVYFPTEFLHGLFDGGHGAGLEDYWNLMLSKPLSAGGFLWVLADEGIERRDKNDSIDTKTNKAPDGIVGPYHQKEASFYTIKEIWSPIYFKNKILDHNFSGILSVSNRYLYTNLNQCTFTYELVRFNKILSNVNQQSKKGIIQSPNIAAGDSGELQLNIPENWKDFDVLYITATDEFNRQLNTWSWNISTAATVMQRFVACNTSKVTVNEYDSLLVLLSEETSIAFNKNTGLISEMKFNSKPLSFTNGPRFVGFNAAYKQMKHYPILNGYVVELQYDSACNVKWTMLKGGWLQLEYNYSPKGTSDYSGITFNYPEEKVLSATLMGNGPYRVWKNRLKGMQFGVYDKLYNNTITGETWIYPEFKGYYSNFYGVKLKTKEVSLTILSGTNDLYLHLFTPQKSIHSLGDVFPPFPDGNISILNNISAIGTKFSKSKEEGMQGQQNSMDGNTFTGKLFFKIGN